MTATLRATAYLLPADQGLTAGATATAPGAAGTTAAPAASTASTAGSAPAPPTAAATGVK